MHELSISSFEYWPFANRQSFKLRGELARAVPHYAQTDPCRVLRTEVDMAKYGTHDMTDSFLTVNFRNGTQPGKLAESLVLIQWFSGCRSSFCAVSEFMVRTLNSHGIWCSADMFQVTTPWSFQLWCGACRYSFGGWKWPHVVTDDTPSSWTYQFQVFNFVVDQLYAAGMCSGCIRSLAENHLIQRLLWTSIEI